MGQESEALKEDIQQRRASMTGTIDAIEDKVVPSRIIDRRRAAMTGWAGGIKERVMGSASTTAESASSTVGKVGDGVSQVTEAMSEAPAQVQRATAGSPLIAGAVAFGIGALVAALLPETRAEQRAVAAVQPQLNAATEAVKDAGQEAIDTAKSSAQDAAQDLKDSATSHAQDVAGQAKDTGQQVKDAAAERSS